jgi:hypothetical protein
MKRMKHYLLTTFLVLGIALTGVDAHAQSYNNRVVDRVTRIAEMESGDRFTVSARTPRGVSVYAVNPPSRAMLSAIDTGFDELFAIAARHGYRSRLRHSDYTVYIARADRQRDGNGSYSPGFAVSAGQYAGSDYDRGGYIYAAGMVIAYNPSAFLIAEHTRDLNLVSDIVRYEGEHLVLYHNDRRLFHQTADHSRGGGHPILR